MRKRFLYALVGVISIMSICACSSDEGATETLAPINVEDFLINPLETDENNSVSEKPESSVSEDLTTSRDEQYAEHTGSSSSSQNNYTEQNTSQNYSVQTNSSTHGSNSTASNNSSAYNNNSTTSTVETSPSHSVSMNTFYPDDTSEDSTTSNQNTNEDSTSAVYATSGTISGNVKWKVEGTTLTIYGSGSMEAKAPTSYKNIVETVIISDGITGIYKYAFSNYTALKKVTIADSVLSVNSNAFYYCTALEIVQMSNNVTYIGSAAFSCCISLSYINLPATLKKPFEANIFADCYNLTIYGPKDCDAYEQFSGSKYNYVVTD